MFKNILLIGLIIAGTIYLRYLYMMNKVLSFFKKEESKQLNSIDLSEERGGYKYKGIKPVKFNHEYNIVFSKIKGKFYLFFEDNHKNLLDCYVVTKNEVSSLFDKTSNTPMKINGQFILGSASSIRSDEDQKIPMPSISEETVYLIGLDEDTETTIYFTW